MVKYQRETHRYTVHLHLAVTPYTYTWQSHRTLTLSTLTLCSHTVHLHLVHLHFVYFSSHRDITKERRKAGHTPSIIDPIKNPLNKWDSITHLMRVLAYRVYHRQEPPLKSLKHHPVDTTVVTYFQGFTWTAKISTGRDGGKIDG